MKLRGTAAPGPWALAPLARLHQGWLWLTQSTAGCSPVHTDIAVTCSEGATAGLLRFLLTSFTSPWFLGASEGDEITGIEVMTATTVFFFPQCLFLLVLNCAQENTLSRIPGNKYMPGVLSSFLLSLGMHSVVSLKVHS